MEKNAQSEKGQTNEEAKFQFNTLGLITQLQRIYIHISEQISGIIFKYDFCQQAFFCIQDIEQRGHLFLLLGNRMCSELANIL